MENALDARTPTTPVSITALPTATLIEVGDDLTRAVVDALSGAGIELRDGDVLAVASKVVALSEGAVVEAGASTDAGSAHDARRAAARAQASRVVADAPQALVVATHHGFVCANAGIDASNVAEGLLLLPADPDASAVALRDGLASALGRDVAVVVTDTFGRPWRMGQVDVALGVAGMAPLRDERGGNDLHGRRLDVTVAAVADAVAAAADLVRSKASGAPFVLLRGLETGGAGTGQDLVRPVAEDLFPAGGPTLFDHAVTAQVRGHHGRDDDELAEVLSQVAATIASRHVADVTIATVVEPGPAIAVTAPTAVAAGMAVEAIRIVLAGRDIAMAAPVVQDATGPGRMVRVLVRAAGPDST